MYQVVLYVFRCILVARSAFSRYKAVAATFNGRVFDVRFECRTNGQQNG